MFLHAIRVSGVQSFTAVIFFLAVLWAAPSVTHAFFAPGAVDINGYAWSSTIGWISLGNGGTEQVTINTDGSVTGYAWSPHIGWIKFGGLSNFPASGGNATMVDVGGGNYEMRGWARACAGTVPGDCSSMASRSDGWDGWIALSGASHSVQFNASGPVTNSYAWGDDVVGWIDMFSNVSYATVPPAESGCTDPSATNYDSSATTDDGSCTYTASCDANQGNSCTSSSNACGQTNSGTIQCDGSCSASTPSDNSCTPVVDLEAKIGSPFNAGDPTYGGTVYIKPGDDLELSWDSDFADNCDVSFSSSNATIGTEVVAPSLSPGGNTTYQVTCHSPGSGGSSSDSLTATVPNILANTFVADPAVVRQGDQTTLEWDLDLDNSLSATPSGDLTPYSYSCLIRGATPLSDSPYSFNAADGDGSGSFTTRPVNNKFVNELTCGSLLGETDIEVVPTASEI